MQDDERVQESSDQDKFLASDIVNPDDDDLMGNMDTTESDNVECVEPSRTPGAAEVIG